MQQIEVLHSNTLARVFHLTIQSSEVESSLSNAKVGNSTISGNFLGRRIRKESAQAMQKKQLQAHHSHPAPLVNANALKALHSFSMDNVFHHNDNNIFSRVFSAPIQQTPPTSPVSWNQLNPFVQALRDWYVQQGEKLDNVQAALEDKLEMLQIRKDALLKLVESTIVESTAAAQQQQHQQDINSESIEVLKFKLDKIRKEIKKVDSQLESLSVRTQISAESLGHFQRQIKRRWDRISTDCQVTLAREGVQMADDVILVEEDLAMTLGNESEEQLCMEIRDLHSKEMCLKVELEVLAAEQKTFMDLKEQFLQERQTIKDELRTLELGDEWRGVIEDLLKEVDAIAEKISPMRSQFENVERARSALDNRCTMLFNSFPVMRSEDFVVVRAEALYKLVIDELKLDQSIVRDIFIVFVSFSDLI
jgi:hypothetical protein